MSTNFDADCSLLSPLPIPYPLSSVPPLCHTPHIQTLCSAIPALYTPFPNPISREKNIERSYPHFVMVVYDAAYLIRIYNLPCLCISDTNMATAWQQKNTVYVIFKK